MMKMGVKVSYLHSEVDTLHAHLVEGQAAAGSEAFTTRPLSG